MDRIDTISELLLNSGTQFRIYDIGRKITKISKDDFTKVEQNQMPYPFPIQGHANFAAVFWQPQTKTPYIWFIKLPLDERGLLNQGARNHFIAIIIEALGKDLTTDPNEHQQELLNSNPYHFTPAEYKLAVLNSLVRKELKQPASIHFEHFQNYINGQIPWDDWQNIGVQGISDLVCYLDNKEIVAALSKNIGSFPEPVLHPLCLALENHPLPVSLIDALINLANESNLSFIVRALASTCEHPHVQNFISKVLSNPQPDDIYITLSGRCWQALNAQTIELLLSELAKKDDLALFDAIFKDLVAIPLLRPHVFGVMRSESRSDELAMAIGQLFK